MLRVQPVDQREAGSPAMRGDQHIGCSMDEGRDPVSGELGLQGQGQRCHIALVLQFMPGLALHDGNAHISHGRLPAGGGLFPFGGVAAIELVHDEKQALQIFLHGQRCHAVAVGLQQLARVKVLALHFAVIRGGAGTSGQTAKHKP